MELEARPLTMANWADFEELFGPRGACGGCWCMSWRLTRSEFEERKGEANRLAMRALVEAGQCPGVLGYLDGRAVAWCAVAPRADTPGLERSRVLRPVDAQAVWSITCLFVERKHRRQGISIAIIRAAAEHAFARGARIVEAYPVEPGKSYPDAFVWTGLASAYRQAGFKEVARRSSARPIVRLARLAAADRAEQ